MKRVSNYSSQRDNPEIVIEPSGSPIRHGENSLDSPAKKMITVSLWNLSSNPSPSIKKHRAPVVKKYVPINMPSKVELYKKAMPFKSPYDLANV